MSRVQWRRSEWEQRRRVMIEMMGSTVVTMPVRPKRSFADLGMVIPKKRCAVHRCEDRRCKK